MKRPPTDFLGALVTQTDPVRLPDGSMLYPEKPKLKADLTHLAVGLWVGYLAVLFIPGRKGSPALGEKHLVQAYGGMMNIFSII